MAPSIKEIYNARAPTLWNVLCCPLVRLCLCMLSSWFVRFGASPTQISPNSSLIHCLPSILQVATVGNLIRSINIYLLPCFHVMASRFVHVIWGKLCCCFEWPYEDKSFVGPSALGAHEVSWLCVCYMVYVKVHSAMIWLTHAFYTHKCLFCA